MQKNILQKITKDMWHAGYKHAISCSHKVSLDTFIVENK